LPVRIASAPVVKAESMPDLEVEEGGADITVEGSDFKVSINKQSGAINSFISDGDQLIRQPLKPNFWRTPTDNDQSNGMHKRQGLWKSDAESRLVKELRVEKANAFQVKVNVLSRFEVGEHTAYRNTYTFYGNGTVEVESAMVPADTK